MKLLEDVIVALLTCVLLLIFGQLLSFMAFMTVFSATLAGRLLYRLAYKIYKKE